MSKRIYLSDKEMSQITGRRLQTLRNRLSKRTFPLKSLRNGRQVLFTKTDVEHNMATLGFVS